MTRRRCDECSAVHDPRDSVCSDVLAYRELLAHPPASLDCLHGVALGAVARPWCGTPPCPRCRRQNPIRWRPWRAVLARQEPLL